MQAAEYPRAIDLFEQTIEAAPDFASAYACLALAWLGSSDGSEAGQQQARQLLQQAEAIDPDDPMMLTVSAQLALMYEGRSEAARMLLDRALAVNQADAHTHLLSAWQYSTTGDYAEAKQAIQQALALEPLSPQINRHAAQVYRAAGDADKAAQFMQLADELSSET